MKNWKNIFIASAVFALLYLIICGFGAGASGDEYFHVNHSENVFNYYKTFGEDKTAATPTDNNNLPYYSQLPDTFIQFIIKTFGIDNYMTYRHLLCNLIAWLGIIFSALLAKKLGGWKAATITVILLLISPRFIGHSFNNLKDIPFASFSIMSIYYIIRFLEHLPKIKISSAIMLTISIFLTTSVRVGGLLMIAYFGLFATVYYIYKRQILKPVFLKTLLISLGICVVSYFLTVLVWPYALEGVFSNVFNAFLNMNKFEISIRQNFEGVAQWSDDLPWYYSCKYMLITIPIVVLVGFVLSLVFLYRNRKNWFLYFVLLFATIFPLVWITINNSNVYGGWRHLIFIYLPLVILSALGISTLIDLLKNKYVKIVVITCFITLSLHPISHSIRNNPYQYVYFNQLCGSTKGAYGQYELDYYYHSLREASEWIIDNAKKDSANQEKIIVACWHKPIIDYYFRNDTTKFKTEFVRWNERGEFDWDYAIFCNTGIYPSHLLKGTFPPKNTVHSIEIDNYPICIVLKREDKNDLYGTWERDKGNLDKALSHYKISLAKDSLNETALLNSSQVYLYKAQEEDTLYLERADSSLVLINRLLKYNPEHENANYFKAYALLMKNQVKESLFVLNNLITLYNPKYPAAYELSANILFQLGEIENAESHLLKIIELGIASENTVVMLFKLYDAMGIGESEKYIRLYSHMERFHREAGDKKMADEYLEALNQVSSY
jgi:tetratricopeptide (TPR) repeat protein